MFFIAYARFLPKARFLLQENRRNMDLRINVEFEYLLESCLDEAKRRVEAFNEIEDKHVPIEEIIKCVVTERTVPEAIDAISKKLKLSQQAACTLIEMPIRELSTKSKAYYENAVKHLEAIFEE